MRDPKDWADYSHLAAAGTSLKDLALNCFNFTGGNAMPENTESNVPSFPQSAYDFVAKNYQMDPETEDLLFDGSYLREGMVVLIENDAYRQDIFVHARMQEDHMARALRFNRWCTVTNIQMGRANNVEFVALYDDGTKRKMIEPVNNAWYVKKDSIPETKATSETFYRAEMARAKGVASNIAIEETIQAFRDYENGEWSKVKARMIDAEEAVTVPAEKLYDRIHGVVSLMAATCISMGRRPKLPTDAEINSTSVVMTQQIVEAAYKDADQETLKTRAVVFDEIIRAMNSHVNEGLEQKIRDVLAVVLETVGQREKPFSGAEYNAFVGEKTQQIIGLIKN